MFILISFISFIILLNKNNYYINCLNYCSVSSVLNTDNPLLYRYHYPIDYFPFSYNYNIKEEVSFSCNRMNDIGPTSYNISRCYPANYNRLCPFNEELMKVGLSVNPQNRSISGFCSWKKYMIEDQKEKRKQRKLLSTSIGSRITQSIQSNDRKRPIVNIVILGGSMTAGNDLQSFCCCFQDSDPRCPVRPPIKDICDDRFCSWSTPLVNWLTKQFPMIDVRFHHRGYGGVSSHSSPSVIGKYLRAINFTENDFIFLDYSVNDAGSCCWEYEKVASDVENMIRRLFYSTRVKPTVIMIEQYPRSGLSNLREPRTFDTRVFQKDYANIYRNLSRHYNLVLWSLREIYWTSLDEKMSPYKRYPISVNNHIHYEFHPAWYAHLFIADVFSTLFQYEMSRCDSVPSHQFTNILPPPLYELSQSHHELYCSFGKTSLLQYTPYRKDLPSEEQRKKGWQEYADKRASGIIITNETLPSGWDLFIQFDTNPADGNYANKLLVTTYLRSYENMGAVEIGICQRRTGVILDALQMNEHVSIPEVHRYEITSKDSESCHSLHNDYKGIHYYYLGPKPSDHSDIRGHRKFKLLGIDVCEIDTTQV